MDYTPLYVGTTAMFVFCAVLFYALLKISNVRRYMEKRDAIYAARFIELETLVKTNMSSILEVLKLNYEKNLKVDKRKSS